MKKFQSQTNQLLWMQPDNRKPLLKSKLTYRTVKIDLLRKVEIKRLVLPVSNYFQLHKDEEQMIFAEKALKRLREGNRRFVSDASFFNKLSHQSRRHTLTVDQEPFAIILGCSDQRVPAKIIFDQGLGDLFVIRVAGNIVAPSQIGSIEFAVERLDTQLVVVMGHSQSVELFQPPQKN